MRVAVLNSFPNHPQSAEAEWIRRFFIACFRLGFEPVEVITSDDITRCEPDCVLVTHEFSPKLTPFPTLGLLWSPPAFFSEDPVRRRSILSLDGHLCGSRQIAQWLGDFMTSCGKPSVIHDGLMLPSTPDAGRARDLPPQLAIMYAGVHWDGSRHGEVFRGLDGRVRLHLYGPPKAWRDRGESCRGILPFDGVSVINAIRDAGISLCLHKAAHREASCPSMRLFEAAAAGALIITDDFEFPREWFRDSVLYLDGELPPPMVVEQIVSHVEWANRNPAAANRLANRSNELFRRRLTLESMLEHLPEFVDRVRDRRCMVVQASTAKPLPVVEYVVRIGSRPATTLMRALDSLAAQTYQEVAVILVQFYPVAGLDAVIDQYRSRFRWIRHVLVANNGNRATAWWAGLNAVTADFFGMLDDDDTLFSNHVASLMDCLEQNPDYGFVYSGLIKVEDEPGHYVTAFQFNGPAGKLIEERREIYCLEKEDFVNLLPTRNVIGHNSWICRSSLLDSEVLSDPGIEVSEDVYFMTLMAGRTRFGFTAMATAAWHWRSTTKDNWTLSYSEDTFQASMARWQERLQNVSLPSHNKVPLPSSRHDVNRATNRDLS
jgi:Glycosyl transferase family 2/Glycosyl transferases group 1